MKIFCLLFITVIPLVSESADSFTVGTAIGLAAGTTGGGDTPPVYPTTTAELIKYLKDSAPRVIVINKTFDFRGTEGSTTEEGCRPDYTRECLAKKNGHKSPDVILQKGGMANTGGCSGGTSVTITYDKAAITGMEVMSHKTLRGIGTSGVIMGKGLWLNGDNIIIQNVHITELNHHVVWGGDAIYLRGNKDASGNRTPMNKIWLDHIKVSRVGRQFVATDRVGVSSMTISNSDFDGRTDYSASCDGRHFWSFLFTGTETRFSMINNYIHSTSGRSPKLGGEQDDNVVAHIANNYWHDNSGHSFDVGINAWILAEGNTIQDTMTPLIEGPGGALFAATTPEECVSYLGRPCVANSVSNSGPFASRNGGTALSKVKAFPSMADYKPRMAEKLSLSTQNFGVGPIGGVPETSPSSMNQNPVQEQRSRCTRFLKAKATR